MLINTVTQFSSRLMSRVLMPSSELSTSVKVSRLLNIADKETLSRRQMLALLCAALVVSGCASPREFMPTPNLFRGDVQYRAPMENSDLDIVYVTDRANSTPDSKHPTYTNARSMSAAFGVAKISLSPDIDRQTLAAASDGDSREVRISYGDIAPQELGRFPETPYVFSMSKGNIAIDPDTLSALEDSKEALRKIIVSRLETRETNDVVLFVHGFNNSFDYGAQTLGGLWHFLERRQVPILYSWPSGAGGLRGYLVDKVSGQFTVFHLKELLRTLTAIEEIDNIHIVAHSQGTNVITTALRELIIENRGAGINSREEFGIANLILAAPDLDYAVIRQRLMAEAFGSAFGKVTVYTTSTDKALTFAQLLMKGIRFGLLTTDNIDKRDKSILEVVGNVSIVQAQNIKTLTGHDYYVSDPAVSSDLLRVIGHGAKPGTPERPLTHEDGSFWLLHDDYPVERLKVTNF